MSTKAKPWFRKLVYILSSFGVFSALGYYLIDVENKALGKQTVSQTVNTELSASPAELKHVVDGDTIKVVTKEGREVTVRLLGIDTPETSGSPRVAKRGVADCMANESTEALRSMVEYKQVVLESDPSKDTHDKYGRLLAYVFTRTAGKQINVNKQMIEGGYAYEYTYHGKPYKYQQEFKSAQREAELAQLGLWAPGACE